MADTRSFPPIADLLKRQGIWLDKKKSQHFLKSQEVCALIADEAELTRETLAVEVGAGLGNLTVELSARAGHVISVEADDTFAEWHKYLAASYPSIDFVHADFLQQDLDTLVAKHPGPVCGAGNLPYQITSEILFRFVDAERTFDRLVFMIQREVAERIAAGPGARASGALTYKIALRYTAEIAFDVAPDQFLPPPRVWSSVIVLKPLERPHFRDEAERQRVYKFLDGIFRYRRKTLSNAITMSGALSDRGATEEVLADLSIDAKRRPETLELDEVMALVRRITEGPVS